MLSIKLLGHAMGRYPMCDRILLVMAAYGDSGSSACLHRNGDSEQYRQQEPQDGHRHNLRLRDAARRRTALTLCTGS
ncbi:hypothetical protein WG922_09435 [Ramlibacter sp. AN1015]|uniref:hypothetical protein n=1 Tax=Ramlibacter sp. AN1015 TaxID=3133428 RepID=UPI0030C504DD